MSNLSYKKLFISNEEVFCEFYQNIKEKIGEGYSHILKIDLKGKIIPFRFYKSETNVIAVVGPADKKEHKPFIKKGNFFFYDPELKNTLRIPFSQVRRRADIELENFTSKKNFLSNTLSVQEIESILLGEKISVLFTTQKSKFSKTYFITVNIQNLISKNTELLIIKRDSFFKKNLRLKNRKSLSDY